MCVTLSIPITASAGYIVAKSQGLPERFALLNPFILELTAANDFPFYTTRDVGVDLDGGKVLFIGDSMMQHYYNALVEVLSIHPDETDIITFGGCPILLSLEAKSATSKRSIQCDQANIALEHLDNTYDAIFIGNFWQSSTDWADQINGRSPTTAEELSKSIKPRVGSTVKHLSELTKNLYLIGASPLVTNTSVFNKSNFISSTKYQAHIENIRISNLEDMLIFDNFFEDMIKQNHFILIKPYEIFCQVKTNCVTHSDNWSYFSDNQHLTQASHPYLITQLKKILKR